ncbi:NfeD family protein [Methanococcus sp. CF]
MELGYITIIIGMGLILLEAFLPGLNFPVAGVAVLIYGIFLLYAPQWALPSAIIAGLLTAYIMKRFVYKTGLNVKIGAENLIGDLGDLVDDIDENNYSHVIIHGEKWQAKSEKSIKKGSKVIVTGIEGVSLLVEEVPDDYIPKSN